MGLFGRFACLFMVMIVGRCQSLCTVRSCEARMRELVNNFRCNDRADCDQKVWQQVADIIPVDSEQQYSAQLKKVSVVFGSFCADMLQDDFTSRCGPPRDLVLMYENLTRTPGTVFFESSVCNEDESSCFNGSSLLSADAAKLRRYFSSKRSRAHLFNLLDRCVFLVNDDCSSAVNAVISALTTNITELAPKALPRVALVQVRVLDIFNSRTCVGSNLPLRVCISELLNLTFQDGISERSRMNVLSDKVLPILDWINSTSSEAFWANVSNTLDTMIRECHFAPLTCLGRVGVFYARSQRQLWRYVDLKRGLSMVTPQFCWLNCLKELTKRGLWIDGVADKISLRLSFLQLSRQLCETSECMATIDRFLFSSELLRPPARALLDSKKIEGFYVVCGAVVWGLIAFVAIVVLVWAIRMQLIGMRKGTAVIHVVLLTLCLLHASFVFFGMKTGISPILARAFSLSFVMVFVILALMVEMWFHPFLEIVCPNIEVSAIFEKRMFAIFAFFVTFVGLFALIALVLQVIADLNTNGLDWNYDYYTVNRVAMFLVTSLSVLFGSGLVVFAVSALVFVRRFRSPSDFVGVVKMLVVFCVLLVTSVMQLVYTRFIVLEFYVPPFFEQGVIYLLVNPLMSLAFLFFTYSSFQTARAGKLRNQVKDVSLDPLLDEPSERPVPGKYRI